MAKINIVLNNKTYQINESALTDATDSLKSHLSTTMSGTGATIKLDGATYNINGTKLSTATNNFISHLGTIAGSGSKVMVNGVEYSIGTDKVAGAISELETVLGGLNAGGDDTDSNVITWDGNKEGRYSVAAMNGMYFVKVSDKYVDQSNFVGATLHTTKTDGTTTSSVIDGTYIQSGTMLGFTDEKTWVEGVTWILSVHSAETIALAVNGQTCTFEEGLYFMYGMSDGYNSCLELLA